MNDHNNIPDEDNNLHEMAPMLSKLSADKLRHTERDQREVILSGVEGRSADDSYFDSFNSKLQNRIDDIEEIRMFAPVLLNIPKYSPFEVPVDYFDDLPSIIQEKTIVSHVGTRDLSWLWLIFKPRFIIPFAATIIVAVAGINYMNRNAEILSPDIEELSLEEHLYYIDEAAIFEQYADETSEDEVAKEDSSIEDYLIDNDIEETDL